MDASTANRERLSAPAIVIIGLIAAFFILFAVIGVRLIVERLPGASGGDLDELIADKKYDQARALITRDSEGRTDPGELIAEAKLWMALAWEKQNRGEWRAYGTNPRDWLNVEEADRAERALKKALKIDPDNVEAHYQLGNLYYERGWHSLAEAEYMDALREQGDHIESRINLGALYARVGKPDAAREELLEAHRLDSDNPRVAKNLSLLYRFKLHNPESSMIWANRYLNTAEQGDYDVNVVRRELLEMLERYPEYAPREPMDWREKRFPARR
jgi:tetratricopeptide (TPR) repeat protein